MTLLLAPEPGTSTVEIAKVVEEFRSAGLISFEDDGKIHVEGEEAILRSLLQIIPRPNCCLV